MSNAAALAAARLWVGTPYLVGQATRGAGCDCLGLLRGVWADVTGRTPPAAPPAPEPWPSERAVEAALRAALDHWLTPRAGAPEDGDAVLIGVRRNRPATHLGVWDGGSVINAHSLRAVRAHPLPAGWRVEGAWSWEGVA